MPNRKNDEVGFWLKTKLSGSCLEWQGSLLEGYGRYTWKGKLSSKAHRVSWAIIYNNSRLPSSDRLVCHHCDNPQCVNPQHLYLGSPKTNMEDRDRRKRHIACAGEANGTSKLTTAQVKKIRSIKGKSQLEIAKIFGVGQVTISRVLSKKTWRHIK